MIDPMKPITPETPTEKELARFEKENEGLEVIESLPEKIEAEAEKPVEHLKKRIVAEIQERKEKQPEDLIKEDVAERIETIINNFVKSAVAAGLDNEEKVEQIMSKAKMYIAKGYPQIADEVHDRILETRNKGMG